MAGCLKLPLVAQADEPGVIGDGTGMNVIVVDYDNTWDDEDALIVAEQVVSAVNTQPLMIEALTEAERVIRALREYASSVRTALMEGKQVTYIDLDTLDAHWMAANRCRDAIDAAATGRAA